MVERRAARPSRARAGARAQGPARRTGLGAERQRGRAADCRAQSRHSIRRRVFGPRSPASRTQGGVLRGCAGRRPWLRRQMPVRIEALGPGHRSLLTGFQNQHPPLVEYLKRYALRHATKDLLARTFVAIDDTPTATRLAGYFSLATVSVDRAAAENHPNLTRLPRFPIPGRLACSAGGGHPRAGPGPGAVPIRRGAGPHPAARQSGTSRVSSSGDRRHRCRRRSVLRTSRAGPLGRRVPCRMVLDLRPILDP